MPTPCKRHTQPEFIGRLTRCPNAPVRLQRRLLSCCGSLCLNCSPHNPCPAYGLVQVTLHHNDKWARVVQAPGAGGWRLSSCCWVRLSPGAASSCSADAGWTIRLLLACCSSPFPPACCWCCGTPSSCAGACADSVTGMTRLSQATVACVHPYAWSHAYQTTHQCAQCGC